MLRNLRGEGGHIARVPVNIPSCRWVMIIVAGSVLSSPYTKIALSTYAISDVPVIPGQALVKQQKLAADATVEVAGAMVSQRQAELNDARHHFERDTSLLARQDVSKAQADSDHDKLDAAQASLKEGLAISSPSVTRMQPLRVSRLPKQPWIGYA